MVRAASKPSGLALPGPNLLWVARFLHILIGNNESMCIFHKFCGALVDVDVFWWSSVDFVGC